jgi:beta-glucosidase
MGVAAGLLVPSCATSAPTTPVAVPATLPGRAPASVSTIPDKPVMKNATGQWVTRHEALVALAKKGDIDLYFSGDSITDFWQTRAKTIWDKEFLGWKPGNFGISADHTQHVLWRLQNGELDGVNPKVFVLMIGTNNTAYNTPEEIARGVTAIVQYMREQKPNAKILLLAIFPRGATPTDPKRILNEKANELIAKLDDGKQIKFLNINDKLLDKDGNLPCDIMPDLLHPNAKGYQLWADAIKPQLIEWLGPLPATQPAPR